MILFCVRSFACSCPKALCHRGIAHLWNRGTTLLYIRGYGLNKESRSRVYTHICAYREILLQLFPNTPKPLVRQGISVEQGFEQDGNRTTWQWGEHSMLERVVEQRLVEAVRKAGGLCPKFVSPGWDGVPDRLVLLPGGRMAFVELKAPGKTMRPLQVRRKEQLEGLGFSVYRVDGTDQIGGVLDAIQAP